MYLAVIVVSLEYRLRPPGVGLLLLWGSPGSVTFSKRVHRRTPLTIQWILMARRSAAAHPIYCGVIMAGERRSRTYVPLVRPLLVVQYSPIY